MSEKRAGVSIHLNLLDSERPKLYGVLAILSTIGLNSKGIIYYKLYRQTVLVCVQNILTSFFSKRLSSLRCIGTLPCFAIISTKGNNPWHLFVFLEGKSLSKKGLLSKKRLLKLCCCFASIVNTCGSCGNAQLTLKVPNKIAADDILIFYFSVEERKA